MNYKAGIVSLGCAKNQVDAEMLLYNLKERGFTIVNDPADGWGRLADMGYDIIQTDWTGMLREYLEESGKMRKQR